MQEVYYTTLLSRLAFGRSEPKRNLWQMKMCNLTLSGDVKGGNGQLYFEYRVQSLFFLLYKNVQDCFSDIQNKDDKCGALKPLTIMAIQSLLGQTRVLEHFSTE